METLKKRILVVDEDEVMRDLLNNHLKSLGYEVSGAPNGQAALDVVLVDPPDMIITAIQMPFMNGFQLLRAVKCVNPDLPVVFITKYPHFRRFFGDKTAKADSFLDKPKTDDETRGFLETTGSLAAKYL